MAGVLIRRALPADLEDLLSLFRELAGSISSAAPNGGIGSEPLLREILADPSRHLLVAVLEGRVVGTADLLLIGQLTHQGMPWGIIENVVVAESARRQGVGRQLFEHLLELGRDAGCCKLQLLSGKHREEAHEFYLSLGFEAVAEGFKIYFDR